MLIALTRQMTNINGDTGETEPISVRETARGIAVRAGILSVVALAAGAWLFGVAAKAASGVVKVVTGVLLLAIGAAFAAWQIRKVQQSLTGDESGGNGVR